MRERERASEMGGRQGEVRGRQGISERDTGRDGREAE